MTDWADKIQDKLARDCGVIYNPDPIGKAIRKAKADGLREAATAILKDATKDRDGTVTTGQWAFDKIRAHAEKIERAEPLDATAQSSYMPILSAMLDP